MSDPIVVATRGADGKAQIYKVDAETYEAARDEVLAYMASSGVKTPVALALVPSIQTPPITEQSPEEPEVA